MILICVFPCRQLTDQQLKIQHHKPCFHSYAPTLLSQPHIPALLIMHTVSTPTPLLLLTDQATGKLSSI